MATSFSPRSVAHNCIHELVDRLTVHSRRASVTTHRLPGRLQRVPPIDPVIQGLKPELRLLLCLLAQLLSQLRKFHGQPFVGLPLFRSGNLFQAAFSSSSRSAPRPRPLGSTVVTRFPATMGLSDSRPGPLPGLWIPPGCWRSPPPPRRASQVPRRICPRAPSPSTPESPTTACAHTSSPVSGFILKGRTGHSRLYPFTRPNRFAFATAHEFASPGFASRIAPTLAGSATCTMGNLHGQYLATNKIRQASPGAPLSEGASRRGKNHG